MTRDEAIEIEKRKLTRTGLYWDQEFERKVATLNIDALIELGLLKVDEPQSLRDKFDMAMVKRGMIQIERLAALSAYDEVIK